MKIIFLCGSLEPGRDGVGDYTRCLAAELIRRGHRAAIIALRDKAVDGDSATSQDSEGVAVPVLRLPAKMITNDRFAEAASYITAFNPEWISLQYVPFSFHNKGLCYSLGWRLAELGKGRKWHVMFHELWCGMSKLANLREKILGIGQKIVLKKIVLDLSPQAFFTSIKPYSDRLIRLGINPVNVVPLFGSIPLQERGDEQSWQKLIIEKHLESFTHPSKKILVLGFFGSIYKCQGLEALLKNASIAAKKLELSLGIIFVGYGHHGDVAQWVKSFLDVEIALVGPLEPAMLNRVLNIVDFGVITTPADGLNKSGAAVAWMERAIPVLIPWQDESGDSIELERNGVFRVFCEKDVRTAFSSKGRRSPQSRLNSVVQCYEEHLSPEVN